MNHKVGVWLDHKSAVIVSTSAGHVSSKTLDDLKSERIPAILARRAVEARRSMNNATASNLTVTTR